MSKTNLQRYKELFNFAPKSKILLQNEKSYDDYGIFDAAFCAEA